LRCTSSWTIGVIVDEQQSSTCVPGASFGPSSLHGTG
jgi:hypothetical protein